MVAADSHLISIAETGSSYKDINGRQAWRVNISLDSKLIHPQYEIYDPFSENQHIAVLEYLEQLLSRESDIKSAAAETSAVVDNCASNLFAQLNLPPLLSKARIQIDIRESEDRPRAAQTDTIYRIPWELLEKPDHWHGPNSCVTVTRMVAPAVPGPELKRVCSWSTDDSINILLVVARQLSIDASGRYEHVLPSYALSAIQNAQRKLSRRQDAPRITLEIVRPGTYQAFKDCLERTTRDRGRGYFHMVHFDLHGRVKKNTAYLRFANKDGKLVDKPASVVAELLAANGVPSAVINACESASASKGVDANLARIFAQKRISNILAMSYRFSSSAATIFLTSFYTSLFIETLPFSEAAGRARATLREQRERKSRSGLQCEIQDWFVPAMYKGDKDLRIAPRSRSLQRSLLSRLCFFWMRDDRNSIIPKKDRWLSMLSLFVSPLLSLCSSASVPASLYSRRAESTSSLADQSRRLPKMVCLRPEAFDTGQNHRDPLVLDSFILHLEHNMVFDQQIFLHGPPGAGKSFFLDRLSHLWLSTNFAGRVYVIQADIFLEGWFLAQLRNFLYLIQGHNRFLYATARLPRSEGERLRLAPRTVVIVDHIDQIFSSHLTSQQKAQAKARLDAFLLKVMGRTTGKTNTLQPDLILVGRQGEDWLHKAFKDVNIDPTPIFLDSRPALHHLE